MNVTNRETDLTSEMLNAIEADLQESLALARNWLPAAVEEMIRYHLGWEDLHEGTGKRVRPLITLLCCQAAGGDWCTIIPAAAAVEWIHNFSLVHDDIQDRSEIRRGRPTVWKKWGNAQAINTGDAIFALARLTTHRLLVGHPPEKVLSAHRLLDETSLALTRGQHLDISFEQKEHVQPEQYLDMIGGKTAALLGAACQLGALLSPASDDEQEEYRSFGVNLGLAYQVIDDLLGIWGKTEATGKSTADDLLKRKKTLPVIYALENSDNFRRAWTTAEHSQENINHMKKWLDEAGSREFTVRWAEFYTDKAMASLDAAKPLEPGASALSELAARLLQRVA
jgi:geranylgeranyl diphosphate synthase type I